MTALSLITAGTAAIYLRTSTAEQAERFGPAAQEAACRRYADQEGLTVAGVYQDEVSGAKSDRPALKRLLRDASKYQAVIVYHHDRLARDTQLSYSLLDTFDELGLELHATNTGRLKRDVNFGILSVLAEEERRRILERTQAGRVAKALKGGIPVKVDAYAYRYIKGIGTVEIDPREADVVRLIFQLASDGRSWRSIALELAERGVRPPRREGKGWSPNAVTYLVRNPIYKGEFVYGRVRAKKLAEPIPIPVPAIVSPELWALAQRGKRVFTSRKGDYALTGHIFCGECGGTMSGKWTHNGYKRYNTYACNRRGRVGEPRVCHAPQISALKLEQAVEQAIRDAIQGLEPPATPPQPENKARLAELDRDDARWLEAFRIGAINAEELNRARKDIQRQRIQIAKANPATTLDLDQLKRASQSLPLSKLLRLTRARVVVHSLEDVELELLGG